MPRTLINPIAGGRPTIDRLTSNESFKLTTLVSANPDLLKVVDTVVAQPTVHGQPRAQMTAPIAPTAQVEDTVYFEEPTAPAQRYYLPRYRLATDRVSGTPHYRMRLAEVNGQWRLAITLEAFAAPALGTVPPETRVLPHELGVALRWQIHNTGGATRELTFTERLTNADGTLGFALTLGTLPERDALYTALTTEEAHTLLLIQRLVTVAISTTPGVPTPRSALAIGKIRPDLTMPTLIKPDLTAPDLTQVVVGPMDPGLFRPVHPIDNLDNILTTPPILRPDFPDPILVRPGRFDFEQLKPVLPIPQLEITGQEVTDVRGTTWLRYNLRVANWQAYGDERFAPAPDLPPCGLNTNASRTWVDIFDSNNQRIYGFCALGKASDLENLWVATQPTAPLQGIYIELVDRRANLSARSNTVTPPPLELYETVTRTVESQEALFFNPQLHGYIFQGFTHSTSTGQGLIERQVNYNERWYSYFQDEVQPHLFYYLPDAFKLARSPDGKRTPLLLLELLDGEPEQYRLTYVAMAAFDWDRLEAAETVLQQYIPAGQPKAIGLEPFQTSAVTFVAFAPALYRNGAPTTIGLNVMRSTVLLTQDEFATIWDELNGRATLSLSGKLQVAVQGFPAQEIPVTLHLADTVGELLSITTTVDVVNGGYRLTLQNGIESPVHLTTLGAFVQSVTRGVADVRPATWRELALPTTPLAPGETITAFLAPPPDVAVQAYVPLVDTDQVQVLPATEVIFDAMLAASVRAYQRPVTVQVPKGLFTSRAEGAIAALQVTFVGGETVILTPPADEKQAVVSATAQVNYPLKEVLLGRTPSQWYQYTVVVVWANGIVTPPSAPQAGEATTFFLRVPQLS